MIKLASTACLADSIETVSLTALTITAFTGPLDFS